MNFRQWFGILRSRAMYYWKPFNRNRLKRFYSQFIKEGDLCFDIGAHLGNRSEAFSSLGAKVIAVDPQPVCIDFLKKKFASHPNVEIIPKAVSSEPGSVTLHISHATPTISTASDEQWREQINGAAWYDVKWEESVEVPAITLDMLIEEYGMPDFCKVDVENYEAQVLEGLSVAIPCLSFEYYPPHMKDTLRCFDILSKLGTYEFNWSFGESQKLNSDDWLESHEMRAIISSYSTHGEYGDVYARLVT